MIKSVTARILDNRTVLRTSVLEIRELSDLASPKLGATAADMECESCHQPWYRCPGHHGHLVLRHPVIKIHFAKHAVKFLNTYCFHCARKHSDCACPGQVPSVEFGLDGCHLRVITGDDSLAIGPEDVYYFCVEVGVDYFMWRNLYIPSLNTRPGVLYNGHKTQAAPDWLKYLRSIFTASTNSASVTVNLASEMVQPEYGELENTIAMFHSTRHKTKLQRKMFAAPRENVEDRYRNQKNGRFRSNITARRVNHAMRGVLEGSINIGVDQVVIPRAMCTHITIATRVARYNAARAQLWIRNGPTVHPGANFCTLHDGTEINLALIENRRDIDIRSVRDVRRHVVGGDMVLINRQPTLHRGSMFALRVLVNDDESVFRLHYALFPPLGADCDGDEINVHVPQTVKARADMDNIRVKYNILKDGRVWVKFIQNAIIGAYLLSDPSCSVSRESACQLIYTCGLVGNFKTPFRVLTAVSGPRLFSLLLPDDFYFKCGDVLITNGTLVSGRVTKSILNGTPGIIYRLVTVYSPERALMFVEQGYRLFQGYLDLAGHSVGLFDCQLPVGSVLENTIKGMAKSVNGSWSEETIQEHIQWITHHSTSEVRRYLTGASGSRHNGLISTLESGAKGSWTTLNQMAGCVGQVYVGYRRFEAFSSHFKGDGRIESRGFVGRAYSSGVCITDHINSAPATCESVVAKNRGTAKSGYSVRKMSCCMLGLRTDSRARVLDTLGGIVWDVYGGDGFLASALRCIALKPPVSPGDSRLDSMWCDIVRGATNSETVKVWTPVDLGYLVDWWYMAIRDFFDKPVDDTRVLAWSKLFWDKCLDQHLVPRAHAAFRYYWFTCFSPARFARVRMTGPGLEWLEETVMTQLAKNRIAYGEAVGIHSVQCLGEPLTQLSLKTPHLSGKFGAVVSGHTKFAQLVDGCFRDPSMEVWFPVGLGVTRVRSICLGFCAFFLRSVISGTRLNGGGWLEIQLDRDRCVDREMTPFFLVALLCRALGKPCDPVSCAFARATSEAWWIKIAIQQVCVNDVLNITHNTLLGGSSNITDFVVERASRDGNEYWKATLLGSDVPLVASESTNIKRWMKTTDVVEMAKYCGIVVARKMLVEELWGIMCTLTTRRHVELLARYMTYDGTVRGFKANQIGQRTSFLQRAAFEQSVTQLKAAAIGNEVDHGTTIAGSIFAHKAMNVGSGAVELKCPVFKPLALQKFTEWVSVRVPLARGSLQHGWMFIHHSRVTLTTDGRTLRTLPVRPLGQNFGHGTLLHVAIGDSRCATKVVVVDVLVCCGHACTSLRYDQRLHLAYATLTVGLGVGRSEHGRAPDAWFPPVPVSGCTGGFDLTMVDIYRPGTRPSRDSSEQSWFYADLSQSRGSGRDSSLLYDYG